MPNIARLTPLIFYACSQYGDENFNSYTYTDGERYSSTTPTGGTRPVTSEAGAQRYHRKKLRKVS